MLRYNNDDLYILSERQGNYNILKVYHKPSNTYLDILDENGSIAKGYKTLHNTFSVAYQKFENYVDVLFFEGMWHMLMTVDCDNIVHILIYNGSIMYDLDKDEDLYVIYYNYKNPESQYITIYDNKLNIVKKQEETLTPRFSNIHLFTDKYVFLINDMNGYASAFDKNTLEHIKDINYMSDTNISFTDDYIYCKEDYSSKIVYDKNLLPINNQLPENIQVTSNNPYDKDLLIVGDKELVKIYNHTYKEKDNHCIGIYNIRKHDFILPCQYRYIMPILNNETGEEYFMCEIKSNDYIFIDKDGNYIFKNEKTKKPIHFAAPNNMAFSQCPYLLSYRPNKDNTVFYIDETLHMSDTFEQAFCFDKGVGVASKNGLTYIVNKELYTICEINHTVGVVCQNMLKQQIELCHGLKDIYISNEGFIIDE